MTAYSLALMKALTADRAGAELWYLKSPMKIVRREYTRREAEDRLRDLLVRYLTALETEEWPVAARQYCDRAECGFRSRCWGEEIQGRVSRQAALNISPGRQPWV